MKNEQFTRYQQLRQAAENDVRKSVVDWATAEGADDMTIGQVKSLSGCMAALMNHHTRQVYDMMKSQHHAETAMEAAWKRLSKP